MLARLKGTREARSQVRRARAVPQVWVFAAWSVSAVGAGASRLTIGPQSEKVILAPPDPYSKTSYEKYTRIKWSGGA